MSFDEIEWRGQQGGGRDAAQMLAPMPEFVPPPVASDGGIEKGAQPCPGECGLLPTLPGM